MNDNLLLLCGANCGSPKERTLLAYSSIRRKTVGRKKEAIVAGGNEHDRCILCRR